jgi:hypothetical protein
MLYISDYIDIFNRSQNLVVRNAVTLFHMAFRLDGSQLEQRRDLMKNILTKLSQAQAVIIAALLTAIIGGFLAIKAATDPIKIQIEATQTAEARLTNISAIDGTLTAINESLATQGAVVTKVSQTEQALVMSLTAISKSREAPLLPSMTPQASLTPTGAIELSANALGILEMDQRYTFISAPFQDRLSRLSNLGYSVTPIALSLNLDDLLQYQLIYLPTGWGVQHDTWFYDLLGNASDYKSYVYGGGNLVVESPGLYWKQKVTLTILPYPITFTYAHWGPPGCRYAPYVVSPTHFIVTDISNEDIGGSEDIISQIDPAYEVIVEDHYSPSLLVARYGEGRILILNSCLSGSHAYMFSDEAYKRMIEWVMGTTE